MRVALMYGRWGLSFRQTFEFSGLFNDARGLTGSEYGYVRIAQELRDAGHSVTLYTVSPSVGSDWEGIRIKSIDEAVEPCDIIISVNEPDLLRSAPAGAFRICCFWLNDTSFCRVGFDEHVDLFLSPSAPHLRQVMTNLEWRKVEKTPEFPDGKAQYLPEPSKWVALELGCDLPAGVGFADNRDAPTSQSAESAGTSTKIPGRVVHCSSPDRGLHHLLGAWPEIRRAVPHATLHVFYRLEPWLRGFDQTPYFPPIEPLRARANYVEECLRRFQELGGMGVTLRDAVSRETIEREMAQAEVSANPCDTTTWSEGFSCAVLEACAARACPIISGCDALGEVYADLSPVPREPGWVKAWTARVIEALTTPAVRDEQNERAYKLASKLTWKVYAEKLMKEVESRR